MPYDLKIRVKPDKVLVVQKAFTVLFDATDIQVGGFYDQVHVLKAETKTILLDGLEKVKKHCPGILSYDIQSR